MPTKTRLANKTIWSLEDILARCQNARGQWRRAMDRARERMDPVMVAALADLRDEIAEIERQTRDARAGEYNESQGMKHKGSVK